jgi:hypothetical protein
MAATVQPERSEARPPSASNQRSAWDAGCRFDYDNPDYR